MKMLLGHPLLLLTLAFIANTQASSVLNVEFDGEITPVSLSYHQIIEPGEIQLKLNIDGETETLYNQDEFQAVYWFWKATVVKARFEGNKLYLQVLKQKRFGTHWHEPVILKMDGGEFFHNDDLVENIYVKATAGIHGVEITEPLFNQF